MKNTFSKLGLILVLSGMVGSDSWALPQDLQLTQNSGEKTSLKQYQGKVLLVVNTASRCGYTPQYQGLQTLYQRYQQRGFEILAFPSNDFGKQEPGTDAEIKKFCDLNYKVKFPMFAKAPVSGPTKQPLYRWLIDQDPKTRGVEVKWNFEKFLIDREGKVLARYESGVSPESPEMIRAIETELKNQK